MTAQMALEAFAMAKSWFVFVPAVLILAFCSRPPGQEITDPGEIVTPSVALERLKKGNHRFAEGHSVSPNFNKARIQKTFEKGQHPYATILSCSDSRVPPEILFDQGVGDLFVIRVAGNVADVDEIGTAEYGAGHLNTPLVMVLGHRKCGAVTAVANGEVVHGNIPKLVDNIVPAVTRIRLARPGAAASAWIEDAIAENVRQSISDLKQSHIIHELLTQKKVEIVGGVYDIETGTVNFLDMPAGH